MITKPWWSSKTLWLAIIGAAVAELARLVPDVAPWADATASLLSSAAIILARASQTPLAPR